MDVLVTQHTKSTALDIRQFCSLLFKPAQSIAHSHTDILTTSIQRNSKRAAPAPLSRESLTTAKFYLKRKGILLIAG